MSALDLLFPPRCAACGALLPTAAPLCEACQATLLDAPSPSCPICAEARDLPGPCASCVADPPAFAQVHAAFAFMGSMTEAIPRFKYQDKPFLAAPLVELAWPKWRSALAACDAVAPIPLHTARLRERGYDQALLLAESAATRASLPLSRELLVRTRPTLFQVGSNRAERAQNLRGAFAVSPGVKVPSRVALVDDVVTTCATSRDAARALREAGATEVLILALARAI